MKPFLFIILCLFTLCLLPTAATRQMIPLDKAFKDYWEAGGTAARSRAAKKILKTNPAFDEVFSRLETGRTYSGKVKRGRLSKARVGIHSVRYPYVIYVPPSYEPSKSYPAAVYLHGGVASPELADPVIWWRFADTIYNENRITVLPVSWNESMWWQYAQVENLAGIMDLLKQEYNIDENRIYLFGVSDGGTGIYYYASKLTTPWAAFIPVIGSPGVLNSPAAGTEGQIYAVNISNKPFLVFNGGVDPLYPASAVQPFVDLFADAGCNIRFRPKPSFGHTAEWWDKEAEQMEQFMKEHPRVPYPDSLAWETEDANRFGRAHWLVITQLGTVEGESRLNPWNIIRPDNVSSRGRQAFSRKHPSGRVELHKKGNRVDAFTQGVKEFKLLISPRAFDFQQPVEVFTNGVRAFSGKLTPDPAVLLKWAALDNDRTMLFGAEITVTVRGLSL